MTASGTYVKDFPMFLKLSMVAASSEICREMTETRCDQVRTLRLRDADVFLRVVLVSLLMGRSTGTRLQVIDLGCCRLEIGGPQPQRRHISIKLASLRCQENTHCGGPSAQHPLPAHDTLTVLTIHTLQCQSCHLV